MKQALKGLVFALLLIAILSALALFSALAGVLATPLTLLPPVAQHPIWALAVVVVLIGVLSYALWRLQSHTPEQKQQEAQRNRQRERKAMLELVQRRVSKELADSLQGAALHALDLRDQPEAVLALTSTPLTQPKAPTQPEISIVHAYEEAAHKLLILGEPGAGKSTLLRQLTLHLLTAAQTDDSDLPIPVIFNLASWAVKQQPLTDWMVDELHLIYQISRKLGHAWVAADEILPLLDGWDEVSPAHRKACADAINAYLQEHGLVPTVVCSRSQEYWQLSEPHRLTLVRAVEVQPLSEEHITRILNKAGKQLNGLRQTIKADQALRNLTALPLMLNLMLLAYQGRRKEEILEHSPLSDRQQQVLAAYVQRRLFTERVRSARFSPQDARRWLIWLAGQISHRNQSEFYLEQLQQVWLPKRSLSALYLTLVVLGFGLPFGLPFGLIVGLSAGPLFGLLFGLSVGLSVGAYFGRRSDHIEPAEALSWSWKSAVRGLFFGLIVGLGSGLSVGPGVELGVELVIGLSVGLVVGLGIGLVSGLHPRALDPQHHFRPNEGIRRSARNALIVGLVGLLGSWLITWLAFGLPSWLLLVLALGLFSWLVGGGTAVLQHYTLRVVLSLTGSMPFRYVRFLDEATERLLLRKAGSGYVFIHRLVQEYFASLETPPQPVPRVEAKE